MPLDLSRRRNGEWQEEYLRLKGGGREKASWKDVFVCQNWQFDEANNIMLSLPPQDRQRVPLKSITAAALPRSLYNPHLRASFRIHTAYMFPSNSEDLD